MEIKNKKKNKKTLPINQWIKGEITREIRKHLKMKENENKHTKLTGYSKGSA